MQLNAQDKSALEATFKVISPAMAERWSYFLNCPKPKLASISPIKGWPLESEYDSHPNEPISALLKKAPLQQYLDSQVIVLRCGFSRNPGVSSMLLKDVFPGGDWSDYKILYEGFVCIVPGKLAIMTNHEGGIYIYGI